MNTYRTCHNSACGSAFVKRRHNQRHCDTICKERCRDCRSKYYETRKRKLRVLRRQRVTRRTNQGRWQVESAEAV